MKVTRKIPVPQFAGVKRSVEVQHGRRGLGLMFRRGLHGAKNWALEPEANGTPRSPWGKAGRAAIALAPFWIVLSAAMGGPRRGGQQTSVPQAVFFAMIVALVGLGFFSARERRLGREEPWNDLPSIVTEGDAREDGVSAENLQEEPTQVMGKSQVSEPCNAEKAATEKDISDTLGYFPQTDSYALHGPLRQAIPPEPSTLGATAFEGHATMLQDAMQQAITEGVDQGVLDRAFDTDPPLASEAPTEVLRTATMEQSFPQVGPGVAGLRKDLDEADPMGQYRDVLDVTESDGDLLQEAPTVQLRPALQTPLQTEGREALSVQASAPRESLQGTLQVEYAAPGPYGVEDEPIAVDWWATKPDAPAEPVVETPDPEEPKLEQQPPEPVAREVATPAAQPQQGAVPDVVTRWIASQFGPAFSEAEKETARVGVVRWLHEEVASERITQAEAARMLRVHKSTVSRWLNSDPWAD